jgi:hypothetical protein
MRGSPLVDDAVQSQVDAYNAHDVDAFVACYAETVVIEDAEGGILASGRDEMREGYRRRFESLPELRAEIPSRIRVGSYVVDEERVNGGPDGDDVDVVAIYHLDRDGLIDRVRFLR